ncbi:MAG TPA: ABC-F family ATP-binding cassette domain-containing protein [Micromonosporaceae bacterium]
MSSLIKTVSLSKDIDGDLLFADLNLVLGGTDRIGVVGPNGVGKSTLLRVLVGEEPPSSGTVDVAPGTRIGYYAQQIPDPCGTVGAFLAEAPGELAALARRLDAVAPRLGSGQPDVLAEYGELADRWAHLGGWAYQARVDEVRARLGVDHLPADRTLGSLSGGEQARLMLARVLLAEPTVLVLDEPTNHLDAEGGAWLAGYLGSFPGAVLVVTHDRAFLDRVVERVVELDGIHDDVQFYEGGYTAYRAEKQRRWQRLLLDFEAQQKWRVRLEQDIERTKEQAQGVETEVRGGLGSDQLRRYAKKVAKKAKARERRLRRQMLAAGWVAEPRTRPSLTVAFGPTRVARGEPVVTATGLTVAGRLSGVDLDLRAGDRLLVTGPNGAGKTSLLHALAGRIAPTTGSVTASAPVRLLPQTHDTLRLDRSLLSYFRAHVPMYEEDAEALLESYLFDRDMLRRPLATLSAGELRRLLIAVMVNSEAEVLLLDEPTNYLDFDALDVVEAALREYRGTLVTVTHDEYFADAVGHDRRLEVRPGRVDEPCGVTSVERQ